MNNIQLIFMSGVTAMAFAAAWCEGDAHNRGGALLMGSLGLVCLVCTVLSKRTLYPWLISLLSLTLPVVMYYLNTYPM